MVRPCTRIVVRCHMFYPEMDDTGVVEIARYRPVHPSFDTIANSLLF